MTSETMTDGRGDHRGRRLEENQRAFRDFVAEFLGVFRIVAAYADDLARGGGRQKLHSVKRPRFPGAIARAPKLAMNFGDAIAFDDSAARSGMSFLCRAAHVLRVKFQ